MVEEAWDERDDLDRRLREADRRHKELTRHAATLAQRNRDLQRRVAALEQAPAAKADRPVTRPASLRSSRADGFRSGGIRAGRIAAAFPGARLLRLQSPPMRGTDVRAVQTRLRQHNRPVQADGIYGAATRAAVIRFQRTHGLKPDGIVGPKTWASLARTSRK
ncbi:MAG: peptidoglycan-binding domain-containing protein [Nitrospirota bacterium]